MVAEIGTHVLVDNSFLGRFAAGQKIAGLEFLLKAGRVLEYSDTLITELGSAGAEVEAWFNTQVAAGKAIKIPNMTISAADEVLYATTGITVTVH